MKRKALDIFAFTIIAGLLLVLSAKFVFPQSQASNGQIEGTILDQTGAAVANATITPTNIETGVYRFPLLPLGTYSIAAATANFKKFIRDGITLTTGQNVTIDIQLETGEVEETVTVSLDTSIADTGKTDLGRVVNSREVQNLPIPQRNP